MCGIAGIIGKQSSDEALAQMLAAQKHRGPDATAMYQDRGFCVLGHNRLSIIDLSEEGNQPMVDNFGKKIIVFNGEIYNYRELRDELKPFYSFRTQSDTEVLLAAFHRWGQQCLSRFIGMFSFAIWDTSDKTLFAARDRFGVKPFYFHRSGDGLLFASEIKALWAGGVERRADTSVWASYFSYGTYGLPHESFWHGIEQLPGGYSLTYSLEQGLKLSRWYNFEECIKSYPDVADREKEGFYEQLLKDSVRLRFRADVPVGFNLSGGLDSSTLLAIVDSFSEGRNIKAFTFTSGHKDYDELPWVERLLSDSSHELVECNLRSEDVPALAQKVAHFQDEPYGGIPTLAYSNIFKHARNCGVIVLLDGQGMDEAWAGYDYYVKGNNTLIQGTNSSPVRPGCLDPSFLKQAVELEYPQPFDNKLQNLQYRDLFYTKIPRALRFNDRISMMYSTELREPFLDHRLVEFAFAQPVAFKVINGQRKWMLRRIASKYLGDNIAMAPKRPVQTPQREWLVDSLKEWALEMMNTSANDWLDRVTAKEEWDNFCRGGSDNSFYVWQWINTGLILGRSCQLNR
jgi:asparagine synthase (glutamine-hydrolysing)